MSLFFRRAAEQRAITSLPWSHGGPSHHDAYGMEGQLALVPVYAATRLISEAVASLPLQAYRKVGDTRQPIDLPMAFEGNADGTRFDWIQRCVMSLLMAGNSYGLMSGTDTSAAGMPRNIEWLNPERVAWSDMTRTWTYNGQPIAETDLLHVPALVLPGQKLGLTPLGACSATMRTGKATQDFMRDWYRNRAVPGMVFRNEARTVPPAEATEIKERLTATLRSGEPFVTGNDWNLDLLTLSAEDAGFVTSMKLTATQVANIFGVPPEMVGGETGASLTYSTTEQQQIQFINMTLRPWLTRLEAAFSALLPNAADYLRFNVDAMIRIDTETRYRVHQIARAIGLNNIDELRALEDEQPLPNGQGQDYTPLATKIPAKEAS